MVCHCTEHNSGNTPLHSPSKKQLICQLFCWSDLSFPLSSLKDQLPSSLSAFADVLSGLFGMITRCFIYLLNTKLFSSRNTSKCQKTHYCDLQKPLIPHISTFSIITLYKCSWATEMLLSKLRSSHLHPKCQNHRYSFPTWFISYCKSQLAK